MVRFRLLLRRTLVHPKRTAIQYFGPKPNFYNFFKEEEEVKDAWDSSDEEIEVQNDSKVTTPPPTANQRTGSQTETANQKQEKPQTTPPPKVTTPTPNNVATTNGAKDNKKEKTKSQKQNLETKENHKKSQKHKITNETSVPKTEKGEQKGTSLYLTGIYGTVVVLDHQNIVGHKL